MIRRILHNRLFLKNESPTLKIMHDILVKRGFSLKRENLLLLLIKMGLKFTRCGRNSLIHERRELKKEPNLSEEFAK